MSWALSAVAALLGRSDSLPSPDATQPLPLLGVEACLCPPASPIASEPLQSSSVGLARLIDADDVLRRVFPATFPPTVSAEYLEAWVDVTLRGDFAPAAGDTRLERDWLAARRTALGLGGRWIPHTRGIA